MANADESDDKLRKLSDQLDAIDEARAEAEGDRYNWWAVVVGPLRLAGYVGSQHLGWLFAGFHLVVASTGILFFFLPGNLPNLGAALVVGALFGFGAFLAQMWAIQVEREAGRQEDEYRKLLRDLDLRQQSVERKIRRETRRLERG
ncbi:hypothetical protein EV649_5986 [Kribbella sp. VKM Ac-2569]|uniref:TMEM14 family protein n=1 Tax=Kribbella sp. VKM Ac-2569 TaxID=2512220 RepID=UPI00102CB40B|nr:TMEM14 family protein [Kribbella sp. VKM Ac-2569]RZT15200.1 hypothetical protein EV649_5986 [Kribbella sp. VKM Ac-2569]